MSTEHQQYSIANQKAVIAEYARLRGFEVVQTYVDAGISGLDLAHRPGLRQLLDDVISHRAEFTAVLVYDVSRWGRFQDADESAHYEFLCKQSGIQVHYCAEQFPNDNSLLTSLGKAPKRAMAGEFSRELSVKTFAGQVRLTQLGFKMGGQPGYGLKRMLIGTDGTPLRELQPGEWKYLSTQRVILMPGPQHETDVVREIFSMYLDQDMNMREIADFLNERGVLRHTGSPWRRDSIRKILFDPKYAGCAVFARCTKKFRSTQKANPRNSWIVQPNSFAPVVPIETFEDAEKKRLSRTRFCTDEQLLQRLREYVQQHGSISNLRMTHHKGMPSAPAYMRRFGSLWNAYELAGVSSSGYPATKARCLRASITEQFHQAMIASGLRFERHGRTYVVQGCAAFMLDVVKSLKPLVSGEPRWELARRKQMPSGLCAVARLSSCNQSVQDWCLLESIPPKTQRFWLRDSFIRPRSVRETPEGLILLLRER
jgi:DNA invertase Pin-like site-specific DNA recombinase